MQPDEPISHRPVLVEDVLVGLAVSRGARYVDGTVGEGGHTRAILERSAPDGRVLGIDWDPISLERARRVLAPYGDRVHLHEGNYAEMAEILRRHGWQTVQGILLDLGASHAQLTSAERGFSIWAAGPLDMRFSPRISLTAADIINERSEGELRELFRAYGEERWAGRIARAIVRARPLRSTDELARLVAGVVGRKSRRIHPATRVFQALRIEVNDELRNVERGIRQAAGCLERGGRLGVISYHSLEDRLVKHYFRELAAAEEGRAWRILTRKPLRPGAEELRGNPSARSAKLRVLQRLEGER